jgi:phospholipid N-methyltransferase
VSVSTNGAVTGSPVIRDETAAIARTSTELAQIHPAVPIKQGEIRTFVREFTKSPARTGSMLPSSRWVADRMAAPVPERGDPVVVELGPGTGAFSAAVDRRLAGRGHHIAVELNSEFAGQLARRFPALDIAVGDAAQLPELLASRGLATADVIVSGLPWASFPPPLQRRLVDVIGRCLAADGALTAVAYTALCGMPRARRFHGLLRETFEEVIVGRTVWPNVLPARVYTARRARVGVPVQ